LRLAEAIAEHAFIAESLIIFCKAPVELAFEASWTTTLLNVPFLQHSLIFFERPN